MSPRVNLAAAGPLVWLRAAALLTWLLVGAAFLRSCECTGATWTLAAAVALYGLLGAVIYLTTREGPRRPPSQALALTLLQYACVIGLGWLLGNHMSYVLLVLIAGQLPWRLPGRWLLPLCAGATVLLYLVLEYGAGSPNPWWKGAGYPRWSEAGGYFTFQLFALAMSHYALSERRNREALAQANAELAATRALLSETSRQGERLRISRDLHDLIGHHLTALALNLELAAHLSEGRAKEQVEKARAIGKLLLSDVREVVRELRDDAGLDLQEALSRLFAAAPGLETRLSVDPALKISDPRVAQAVLRLAQEALTNTLRHARASRFELELSRDDDGLRLIARDDGRGLGDAPQGNGLRGMLERVRELGGQIQFENRAGGGLQVAARLPLPEAL